MKSLVVLALILATSFATLSDFTVTSTWGSTTAGWTVKGATASDKIGLVLAEIGDFNADTYSDYAIATQHATAPKVYIVLGQSAGRTAALDLSVTSVSNFIVLSFAANAAIGPITAIAGGDLNADNVADIAVGMSSVSRVYVVYGKTTVTWTATGNAWTDPAIAGTLDGSKGFIVKTTTPAFAVGGSIAIADFADDNRPDLILGMPDWTTGGNALGAVCVVYGKASVATDGVSTATNRGNVAVDCETTATLDVSPATYEGNLITGATAGDKLGHTIAAGVDMNNDGFEDIVVTAKGAAVAYIVYGAANRASATARAAATAIDLSTVPTLNAATVGLKITTPAAAGITSTNFIGDFNGDSKTDVAFGYPEYTSGSNNNLGRVYVVFGQANSFTGLTPPLVLNTMTTTYGISYTGKTVDSYFGQVVDGADVNKDGINDLIIAAPLISTSRADNTKSGKVHIIYGSTSNTASVDLGTATQNGITITGVAGTGFATNLAALGLGDVSADGIADFIVSAPGSGTDLGTVYEFRGQAVTPSGSGFRLHLSVLAFAGFLVALMF